MNRGAAASFDGRRPPFARLAAIIVLGLTLVLGRAGSLQATQIGPCEQFLHNAISDSLTTCFEEFVNATRADSEKNEARTLEQHPDAQSSVVLIEEFEDLIISNLWQRLFFHEPPGGGTPPEEPFLLVSCGGEAPVAHLGDGQSCDLTVRLLNPANGTSIVGVGVESVLYQANLDPDTPGVFVELGISSDAGSDFRLSYVVNGFEPIVRATPLDPAGRPIVVSDADGAHAPFGLVVFIDAPVLVPQPGALWLIVLGFALLELRRAQRRTPRSNP